MTPPLPQPLLDRLSSYLTDQMRQAIQITAAQPLAGGASRDTWAFDVRHPDGSTARYVMRRDLPTTMNDKALTRAQEFHVMQAAHQHGVKVARVRWLQEQADLLGQPFFIMEHIEGVSIGRKVMTAPELAEARAALPAQMAQQLAHIHRLPLDGLDFLRRPAGDPAQHAIEETYQFIDSISAVVPAIEYGLRWCARHAPSPDRITFVHGDFRIGNLLVGPHGLQAVIDWEFAHVGDPREELGYLCMRDWRFGSDQLRAAGLTDRETFLRAYEQAAGVHIDRDAVTWWEIIGNIRWAVICLTQAQRHLSGQDPSIELASLGRRSIEMQAEALRLIDQYEHHKAG